MATKTNSLHLENHPVHGRCLSWIMCLFLAFVFENKHLELNP